MADPQTTDHLSPLPDYTKTIEGPLKWLTWKRVTMLVWLPMILPLSIVVFFAWSIKLIVSSWWKDFLHE